MSEQLYEEATVAVRESGDASTTFLQRRFRIGYVTASFLLDELEENGVIGPLKSGQIREILT